MCSTELFADRHLATRLVRDLSKVKTNGEETLKTTIYQIHQYNTRQKNNLQIPITNKLFTSKCIRHNIPITVNSTPEYLLNKIYSNSVRSFTKSIKELYINKYSNTCLISNCYICNKN